MEELSKIAMAYYQASSDHLQKLAHDFFSAMDHDGDGKIDQREFLEFMREEGCGQMTDPFIFNQLDLDGNGTLDFVEKCDHTHDNLSRFVDNYSLLEAMIKLKSDELKSPESRSRPFETDSVSVPNKPHLGHDNHTWNPSVATFQQQWQTALAALNTAVQLGAIGGNLCSIL
ncbi:hypothetical protein R6Q59_014587 [Mikania micrantha]